MGEKIDRDRKIERNTERKIRNKNNDKIMIYMYFAALTVGINSMTVVLYCRMRLHQNRKELTKI